MVTTTQNGVSPLAKSTSQEASSPHATIDFETRSRVEIGDVGAYRYAMDESTRVLCLVYRLPGSDAKLWHPEKEPPLALLEWVKKGNLIEAHNAEFEYCMWKYHCVPKLGWPKLPATDTEEADKGWRDADLILTATDPDDSVIIPLPDSFQILQPEVVVP